MACVSVPIPLSIQLKVSFVKFICKALDHNIYTLNYVTKLACQNIISVSKRDWCDYVDLSQYIHMFIMN